jgi:hypothetical protein
MSLSETVYDSELEERKTAQDWRKSIRIKSPRGHLRKSGPAELVPQIGYVCTQKEIVYCYGQNLLVLHISEDEKVVLACLFGRHETDAKTQLKNRDRIKKTHMVNDD